MAASGERFYLLDLTHRPAFYGDIGHLLKVEGIVVGGEGAQAILMLPDTTLQMSTRAQVMTAEQWVDFLRRSDDPEVLVMPGKAFHRKLRYEISGAVQQQVWVADGLKCQYCGARMGKAQMSIDHWIPLEMGGRNDTSNYLTACRRCNKDKGSMPPRAWCELKKLDYDGFVLYLQNRTV